VQIVTSINHRGGGPVNRSMMYLGLSGGGWFNIKAMMILRVIDL